MAKETKSGNPTETYLGDGLYASWDGYQVRLFTLGVAQNEVFLEPDVMEALKRFYERIK